MKMGATGMRILKKYRSWMDQAAVVKIDWYDYKGIKQKGQLSNLEKLDLNTKLDGINEKYKLFPL